MDSLNNKKFILSRASENRNSEQKYYLFITSIFNWLNSGNHFFKFINLFFRNEKNLPEDEENYHTMRA